MGSSIGFWDDKYKKGKRVGSGSTGRLAEFKVQTLNKFIQDNNIKSVLDIGCGDGSITNKLIAQNIVGADTSHTIISKCRIENPTIEFIMCQDLGYRKAELCISLDVVYHLVDDEDYVGHLTDLFMRSGRFVIIYSSNVDRNFIEGQRIRHRKFTDFVKAKFAGWALDAVIRNLYPITDRKELESFSDFYIFKK